MEQSPVNRKREIIAGLAVLLVIVAIVAATTAPNKQQTTASSASQFSATDSTSAASFKDGRYSATGTYDSPGGLESLGVTLTLKSGVVTAISATSGANDPNAEQYQNDFIASYKNLVIGKKITDINLSRVSGSSLTSQGFNNAIQKIESEARA